MEEGENMKLAILIIMECISVVLLFSFGIFFILGGFDLQIFEYGFIWNIYLIVFAILFLAVPIFIIKIKAKYIITTFALILIMFVCGVNATDNYINNKYQDFSKELWVNKKIVRQIMYKTLEKDEEFLSYNKVQVIEKLGTPDFDNGYKIGYLTQQAEIEINFNDNKIESIKFVDYM